MRWWYVPLVLVDLYLLVTLAPAIATQVLQWLILRSGPYLENEREEAERLTAGMQYHASLWPQEPRVGRYRRIDQSADQALGELRTAIGWIQQLLDRLVQYEPNPLTFDQAIKLAAWRPLFATFSAFRDQRSMWKHLARGESHLLALAGLERQLNAVPERVRASLGELRAEASRLLILLEAEKESGTRGLDDTWRHTQNILTQVEGGLDAIAAADPERVPDAVAVIDGELEGLGSEIQLVHEQVSRTTLARDQARAGLVRLDSALGLAKERWEALKERGVTEPAIARSLQALENDMARIERLSATRTSEAYERTALALVDLDQAMADLDDSLTEMDDLLGKSRRATEGDVQLLAEAQQTCQSLMSADPLLDPDICLQLIEAASASFIEAERQHGLGTSEGYRQSVSLSARASEQLQRAVESTQSLGDQSQEIRRLSESLSPTILAGWRARAVGLREALQVYTLHWQASWSAEIATALSHLDQIEIDLERMSPNVRYQRRFQQSEMPEALAILEAAKGALEQSVETIQRLENELEQTADKRESLESSLSVLSERTLPALKALRERMLPEVRDRYDELVGQVSQRMAQLQDPGSTDYDQALDRWLPQTLQQMEEISNAHAAHAKQSSQELRSAERDLDHLWQRLARLEPQQVPGPSEDIERLADDLDLWRRDAREWEQNPAMLIQLTGQRTRSLAQRIEKARNEITDGRRAIESLARDYDRRISEARAIRQTVRDLRLTSRWSHLEWEPESAKVAWEGALVLERDSRSSPLISEVIEQMRRANNAAEEARQLYANIEHQMRSATRRLDTELRSVNNTIERGHKRIASLDEEGSVDAAAALRIRCDEAARLANRALGVQAFEEALRLLRDARDLLGRL